MTPKLLKADDVRALFDRWIRQGFYEREKIAAQMFHDVLDALPDATPAPSGWQPIAERELREALTDLVPVMMDALLPLVKQGPLPAPPAPTQSEVEMNAQKHAKQLSQAGNFEPPLEFSQQHCPACHGKGYKPGSYGTSFHCDDCNGTGVLPSPPAQATAEKETAPVEPYQSQGRCETTRTERFYNPACRCDTYAGNFGPCKTYERGGNGQCVYCDHNLACHSMPTTAPNQSDPVTAPSPLTARVTARLTEAFPHHPWCTLKLRVKGRCHCGAQDKITDALDAIEPELQDAERRLAEAQLEIAALKSEVRHHGDGL